MFKILGRAVGLLVWLVWLILTRATFGVWLLALWLAVKVPAISSAIQNAPIAVPIVLALISVLVVGRFLLWLTRASGSRELLARPPLPKERTSLLYHKSGW